MQDTRQTVHRLIEAVNRHDAAAIGALAAADVHYSDAAKNHAEGPRGLTALWRGRFERAPDYAVAAEHLFVDLGVASVVGMARRKNGTDKAPVSWFLRIHDQRVVEWRVLADLAEDYPASASDTGWVEEAPFAVTVCDQAGVVLAMNDRADTTFAKDGGRAGLLGKPLQDCHPGASRDKVQALLDQKTGNVYSIEKAGVKKLIYQSPWYRQGAFAGLVELSLVIPEPMPHFVRKP